MPGPEPLFRVLQQRKETPRAGQTDAGGGVFAASLRHRMEGTARQPLKHGTRGCGFHLNFPIFGLRMGVGADNYVLGGLAVVKQRAARKAVARFGARLEKDEAFKKIYMARWGDR